MSTLLTHATSGPKTAGKRRECSHQHLVAMEDGGQTCRTRTPQRLF